jgi:predicted nucleic acid-binding protein
MEVVVSDTTPLHYLILIGREFILEKLYGSIIVPPAVLAELTNSSAPARISTWAARPPNWVSVATPRCIPARFDSLDMGERQALALAKETMAGWILLDDKVARRFAEREKLKVKGTLGIVADAARANLLDFARTVEDLQRTSMHLDPDLVIEMIRQYERGIRG